MQMWRCTVCGYVHEGASAPEKYEKIAEVGEEGIKDNLDFILISGCVSGKKVPAPTVADAKAIFEQKCTTYGK